MGAREGLPAMDREPSREEGLESRVLHGGPRAEGSVVLDLSRGRGRGRCTGSMTDRGLPWDPTSFW